MREPSAFDRRCVKTSTAHGHVDRSSPEWPILRLCAPFLLCMLSYENNPATLSRRSAVSTRPRPKPEPSNEQTERQLCAHPGRSRHMTTFPKADIRSGAEP